MKGWNGSLNLAVRRGFHPGSLGDVNCDAYLNPVDVVLLVNYVYKSIALSECGSKCGSNFADFNCDELTNPVDVVTIVNTTYKGWERPPCS